MALSEIEHLLVAACGGNVSGIDEMNWRQLLALAERHEVASLLAHNIRRATCQGAARSFAGSEFVSAVDVVAGSAVVQDQLEAEETASVFEALDGLPAMLCKGQSISRRWYPPGARIDRDVDIHVAREDYARAKERLLDRGYALAPRYDERLQLLQTKDVGFTREDDAGLRWSVELHVRLTEPGAPMIDPRALWADATTIHLHERTVPVPSAAHSLLLLALNLRKHRYARLKTAIDIVRLIDAERETLDWERLHADAHTWGFCGQLRHAIALSTQIVSGTRAARQPLLPACRLVSASGEFRLGSGLLPILPRVATADTVFGELRGHDQSKLTSGLIPFVSLDKLRASLHLVYERVSLSPEMATYYRLQGDSVPQHGYRSRFDFWRDVSLRLVRAFALLARTGSHSDRVNAHG